MTNYHPKTQKDLEQLRGELFHMILFSMAWSIIGEYALDFRDYSLGVGFTLLAAVCLALYSIKLYDMEDELEQGDELAEPALFATRKHRKSDRLYALILVFEGIAVLVTWSILLKRGHDNWVIPGFAAVAGLHFFPLARVVGLRSYYLLGAWICALAVAGYVLVNTGRLEVQYVNALIAYGCTAGAVIDAVIITLRAKSMFPRYPTGRLSK